MLDQLAKADATRMREDAYAKLCRQQQDGEVFVDPADADGINLDKIHGLRLE
jgi:hypothetical protein